MADVKICDRCGTIFDDKKHWIYIHPERYILDFVRLAWCGEDMEEYERTDRRFDLCPKCMDDLNKFLKGRPLMGEE